MRTRFPEGAWPMQSLTPAAQTVALAYARWATAMLPAEYPDSDVVRQAETLGLAFRSDGTPFVEGVPEAAKAGGAA